MQKTDETTCKVMVWDPFTASTVDVAPLLYVIREYFGSFDHAAARLTDFMEDLISNDCYLANENPEKFRDFMFDLKMLRRAFAASKTGVWPEC